MTAALLDGPQCSYHRPADAGANITLFAAFDPFKQHEAGWSKVIRSLQSLAYLNDDWDGFGAKAPSIGIVNAAVRLADLIRRQGWEAPGRAGTDPSGTIAFEWYHGSHVTEIEVTSPVCAEWMTIDEDGNGQHGTFPLATQA